MINVKVNGEEARKYSGNVKLQEIVNDLYPKDSVLESIRIGLREVNLSEIQTIDVFDGQDVNLSFVSIYKGIENVSKSAIQFLDWLDSQELDAEKTYANLESIANGFDMLESAIRSVETLTHQIKTDEEKSLILKKLTEINSYFVLEKKEEVMKRVQEIAGVYRKIFARVIEGGI